MVNESRYSSLQTLEKAHFDVAVIGGGISGAWIALHCSSAGLKTALVERSDFAAETSSASSKLLHGGIRYLQQLQPGKVRESCLERAHYIYAAPHLATPVPFIVPTYKDVKRSKFLLLGGLAAYSLLGLGQHAIADAPAQALLNINSFSARELNAICDLNHLDHTGALAFPEYHMYDSERSVWAIIESAQNAGAVVANYVSASRLAIQGNRVVGLEVVDQENDRQFPINSTMVINAAGPWVDALNSDVHSRIHSANSEPLIQNFAAGAHIITRPLTHEHAIAINTRHKSVTKIDRGGRHIFIIPWRGYSLIGTSYRETEDPDSAEYLHEQDLNQLLDAINETLPSAKLDASDIISAYAGLYPLRTNTLLKSTYQGSGEYTIIDHESEDGIEGLVTALGAKFTTGRILSKKTVNLVADKLAIKPTMANMPAKLRLSSAKYDDFEDFRKAEHELLRNRLTPEQIDHLLHCYGSNLHAFLEYIETQQDADRLYAAIVPGQPDILGQVAWAVEREMAIRLDDVLYRRTSTGLLGISDDEITAVANEMASLLNWSGTKCSDEIHKAVTRRSAFRQVIDEYYHE